MDRQEKRAQKKKETGRRKSQTKKNYKKNEINKKYKKINQINKSEMRDQKEVGWKETLEEKE